MSSVNNLSDAMGQGKAENNSEAVEPRRISKRPRYAIRACTQCQSRKIRCQGGIPCSTCVARARKCVVSGLQSTGSLKRRATRSSHSPSPASNIGSADQYTVPRSSSTIAKNTGRLSTKRLLSRIIDVEQQMRAVVGHGARTSSEANARDTPTPSVAGAVDNSRPHEMISSTGGTNWQTLVDGITMREVAQAGERADKLPVHCSEPSSSSYGTPFSPKMRTSLRNGADLDVQKHSRSWLREILLSHGVVPEQLEFKTFLEAFFDEVHILHPVLHPPSVWQTFNYLWKHSLLVSLHDMDSNGETRLSVALIFVCLALGRCTTSSRADNADGAHSAGWTLYNVALDIVPSLFDIASDWVTYLFRLDASEKAERTLSHAISGAHILGLHRKVFYTGRSAFEDEMFTRVWWGIYILDRRLAIESGRPYLIQDSNVETRNPLDLSDDWLAQYKSATAKITDLAAEIESETSLVQATTVPYLVALASQSRMATDVWKSIYSTKRIGESMPDVVCEFLDGALDTWWRSLPPHLQYHESIPYEDQFCGTSDWQARLCLSLHMRYAFYKLLIRRLAWPSSDTSAPSHDYMVAETSCAQRAASIIGVFEKIPKTFPRYAFTLVHPMTSAAMILHDITVRSPALRAVHGTTLLSAVQSLISYCQSTWVSSKLIRTVSKLDSMVHKMLGSHAIHKRVHNATDISHGEEQASPQGKHDWDIPHSATSSSPMDISVNFNGQVNPLPTQNDRAIPSPPITDLGEPQQRVTQTQSMAQGPPRLPSSQHDTAGDPGFWLSPPEDGAFPGFPYWAVNNFDFEQALNSLGNSRMANFGNAEFSAFDDEWAQALQGSL
ncbi:fungal-specific transcription factor domain-containing protein [Paraphoma chrysanthemicola]|uniref:Fungal-specific transcription factor domain-containing protein n=1 Tax=Paraphoma chrysanthemicola TaxID=798071 RepID=A0A8K0W486_9PLEO|nr:fungal-specific transcription factor domain-containing protein [Paraphoma chrysanthemicola]